MSKNLSFLYDLTMSKELDLSEEVEIKVMSNLDVATELHGNGLNAARVVESVRTSTSAMRKNAMIAKRMRIERADVQRRAIFLSLMALVGLGAVLFALTAAAAAPDRLQEAARSLLVLIFVGGLGLLLVSLLAVLYVLWNAYVHKAILAEVASDEATELVSAINRIRSQEPSATVTQLVVVLEQNPVWGKHCNV